MGKYNLKDILNEYIGGGRIGTLKTSFRDLVDTMEELEKSGKVIVRELPGPSGDFKVNREFEVVDRDSAVPGGNKQERGFTVYDYKFGFDPGSIDHYEEEYDFSVGGNDLKLAMELIPDVKPYKFEEAKETKSKNVNEGDLFSSEFDRAELKDIINDLNKGLILDMPTRRAYKFLVSLLDKEDKEELGVNEQMYIDDEEFEMEMGRSKKDSLKKEMMIHVDQLIDGNIDMNDFMNVVEDVMAEVNSMNENVDVPLPNAITNKANNQITNVSSFADFILDIWNKVSEKEQEGIQNNSFIKQAKGFLEKAKGEKEEMKETSHEKITSFADELVDESHCYEEDDVKEVNKGFFKKKFGIGKKGFSMDKRKELDEVIKEARAKIAEGSYPFEQCLDDNEGRYGVEGAKKVCGAIRAAYGEGLVKEQGSVETDDPAQAEKLAKKGVDVKLKEDTAMSGAVADELEAGAIGDRVEEKMDKEMEMAAKMIKDRILKDIPMSVIMDFVRTHMDDIKGMSNSEIKDEFEEFFSVNYESGSDFMDEALTEHFKRFM